MSRYLVAPCGLGHHVAIGWNPGLGTFVAHVYEREVENFPVYSIGSTPAEIRTLVAFLHRVRPLALIDDATAARLDRDRTTEGIREPVL